MNLSKLQPSVLWVPIAALAAVQAAFTLSWVIYSVHLPALLTQAGFAADLAPTLLLIEALLAIAVEPIMGSLSDRLERQRKTRFRLIAIGIVLSSALLVALSLLQGRVPELLIFLLLAWAIAMSIFRAPAIALLKRYALTPYLPQAASLLTLAAGAAGAARPFASPLITRLGVMPTFAVAAIALLVTGVALRAVHPPFALSLSTGLSLSQRVSGAKLGLIAATGLTVTLAFRLAIETLPKVLKANLPDVPPPSIVGFVFLAIALTAIPAGALAVRIGNRRTMILGLAAMAVSLGLVPLIHTLQTAIAVAIALGAAFSLISNGTLPFALSLVQSQTAGLGIGTFFGGAAIATSLFLLLNTLVAAPATAALAGIIALLIAGCCVLLSNSWR